jgi:hypothetical protein
MHPAHGTEASTIWFFVRGAESVRVARLTGSDGSWGLLIDGPGPEHRIEPCADLLASVHQQSELERRLIEAGFRLQEIMAAAAA